MESPAQSAVTAAKEGNQSPSLASLSGSEPAIGSEPSMGSTADWKVEVGSLVVDPPTVRAIRAEIRFFAACRRGQTSGIAQSMLEEGAGAPKIVGQAPLIHRRRSRADLMQRWHALLYTEAVLEGAIAPDDGRSHDSADAGIARRMSSSSDAPSDSDLHYSEAGPIHDASPAETGRSRLAAGLAASSVASRSMAAPSADAGRGDRSADNDKELGLAVGHEAYGALKSPASDDDSHGGEPGFVPPDAPALALRGGGVLTAGLRFKSSWARELPPDYGFTGLHLACLYGRVSAARQLASLGADPAAPDTEGRGAVHAALAARKPRAAQALLQVCAPKAAMQTASGGKEAAGAGLRPRSRTTLRGAAGGSGAPERSTTESARAETGASSYARSRPGSSSTAVTSLRVQAGVRRVGRSVPVSDASVAAAAASRLLLHRWRTAAPETDSGTDRAGSLGRDAAGGDLDAQSGSGGGGPSWDRYDLLVPGMTALHVAAAEGSTAGLRMLVRAGAPVHAVDALGRTALHCAAASGRRRQALLLVALCGDAGLLAARDASGRTAMQLAAGRGYVGVCDALAAMAGAAAGGVLVRSIVGKESTGGIVAQKGIDMKESTGGIVAQKGTDMKESTGGIVAQKGTDRKESTGGIVAQKGIDMKEVGPVAAGTGSGAEGHAAGAGAAKTRRGRRRSSVAGAAMREAAAKASGALD